jgi:hypothetical protein
MRYLITVFLCLLVAVLCTGCSDQTGSRIPFTSEPPRTMPQSMQSIKGLVSPAGKLQQPAPRR